MPKKATTSVDTRAYWKATHAKDSLPPPTEELLAYWRALHVANKDRDNAKSRAYYARNRESLLEKQRHKRAADPDKTRRHKLAGHLKPYGLTIAAYETQAALQGGKCAICRQPPMAGTRLVVDHCHTTKRTRELLCSSCNLALGHTREDPEYIAKLLAYIARHKALQ
jgi:hypothetical protein